MQGDAADGEPKPGMQLQCWDSQHQTLTPLLSLATLSVTSMKISPQVLCSDAPVQIISRNVLISMSALFGKLNNMQSVTRLIFFPWWSMHFNQISSVLGALLPPILFPEGPPPLFLISWCQMLADFPVFVSVLTIGITGPASATGLSSSNFSAEQLIITMHTVAV